MDDGSRRCDRVGLLSQYHRHNLSFGQVRSGHLAERSRFIDDRNGDGLSERVSGDDLVIREGEFDAPFT